MDRLTYYQAVSEADDQLIVTLGSVIVARVSSGKFGTAELARARRIQSADIASLWKKYKRLYQPKEPVTYIEGMELSGLILGSQGEWLGSSVHFIIWVLSLLHFLLKIITDDGELETQVKMEALHWAVMSFVGVGGMISVCRQSDTFRELHSAVQSGIFVHKVALNPSQEKVLLEERERIRFYVKLFFNSIFIAFVCTQLKGVIFDLHRWGTQFPGWFPFEINSIGTYAAASLFQLIFGYNLVIAAQTIAVTFTALSGHLCSQMRILSISIQNIFEEPGNKVAIKERMKECIQHHYALIEFYEKLQYFYSTFLIHLAVGMMIMLCLAGYVVTDPGSTLVVILPLFTVFVPEVIIVTYFCYAGQRIMNESEYLYKTVTEMKWYTQPPDIRKDLLLILIKTQKIFVMTGGAVQKFNLEGLAEILQTSYTYFNMLKALRK